MEGRSTRTTYINLAIVTWDNLGRSEMDEFTKATICGNVDNILKEKHSLQLSEVGQLEDDSLAVCVLVQGAPGVGNTTMAQELYRQWAEGELLKNYSLLVLLKLHVGHLQKATNVDDLFYHSDPSISSDVARIGNHTVFLLMNFRKQATGLHLCCSH